MRRSILQTKFYLLSVLLSLASCSQDELAEQGTALPDGMYPMTFTAVQVAPENTPQTRVSDYDEGSEHKSKWTKGDKITVIVSKDGGYTEETTCTLDENGKITEYSPQLYWQTTENYDINAWYYSNITGQGTETGNAVSLANQSGGLAYVLKAKPVEVNYQTKNIALTFFHQLAKVRVKLVKGSYEGELSDATVKVKGYTSCTVTNGVVSEGSDEGYIQMCKKGDYYEANLVPGTLQASNAFEISIGEKTVQASLKEEKVTLDKGTVHEITININAESKDVTIDSDCTITGEHKPIVINGNCTVTFEDARITSDDRPIIKINDGCHPTLVFEGTNVLKRNGGDLYEGGITSGENDEYNIRLEDGAKLAVISDCMAIGSHYGQLNLNISGNGEMWVQSNVHNTPAIIVSNGSLNISKGVVLTAVVSNDFWYNTGWDCVPAIGLSTSRTGVSGGAITLSDCTLKLFAWGRPGNELEHWVTLENGTVTPDVDSALKPAAWDTDVSLDNNVKATKLEERPTPPDWAQ